MQRSLLLYEEFPHSIDLSFPSYLYIYWPPRLALQQRVRGANMSKL